MTLDHKWPKAEALACILGAWRSLKRDVGGPRKGLHLGHPSIDRLTQLERLPTTNDDSEMKSTGMEGERLGFLGR